MTMLPIAIRSNDLSVAELPWRFVLFVFQRNVDIERPDRNAKPDPITIMDCTDMFQRLDRLPRRQIPIVRCPRLKPSKDPFSVTGKRCRSFVYLHQVIFWPPPAKFGVFSTLRVPALYPTNDMITYYDRSCKTHLGQPAARVVDNPRFHRGCRAPCWQGATDEVPPLTMRIARPAIPESSL